MGVSIDCSCDECSHDIDEGSETYCSDCYEKRIDSDEVAEQKGELKAEIDDLLAKIADLEELIEGYKKICPLDTALNTVLPSKEV